jgi:hypothetical protein
MWYSDAEYYITKGMVIVALFLGWSLLRLNFGEVSSRETAILTRVRTTSLMCLAPLGVMQKQMHEVSDLPMDNLLRSVDKE